MTQGMGETPVDALDATEALVERVLASSIGLLDLASIQLGDRLGLYRALDEDGPATSGELAERTGTDERYVREWLEQQAVTDLLSVVAASADSGARRYALPAGHAEALVAADSPSYIAPLGRQVLGMLRPLPQLVEAFRTGEGVPYADYGEDTREGIADLNRVMSSTSSEAPGSPRSPMSTNACAPERGSPTSGAAPGGRASPSRARTPRSPSTASTSTVHRSRRPVPTPARRGSRTGSASSFRTQATRPWAGATSS